MPAWTAAAVTRVRSVPWLVLYKSATWLYGKGQEFWDNLTATERRELGTLIRKSKGRRSNLTKRETDRLRDLVRKGFTSPTR